MMFILFLNNIKLKLFECYCKLTILIKNKNLWTYHPPKKIFLNNIFVAYLYFYLKNVRFLIYKIWFDSNLFDNYWPDRKIKTLIWSKKLRRKIGLWRSPRDSQRNSTNGRIDNIGWNFGFDSLGCLTLQVSQTLMTLVHSCKL